MAIETYIIVDTLVNQKNHAEFLIQYQEILDKVDKTAVDIAWLELREEQLRPLWINEQGVPMNSAILRK